MALVPLLALAVFVAGCGGGGGAAGGNTGAPPSSQPAPQPESQPESQPEPLPEIAVDPYWRNASIYFLLPDRFNNGDTANDLAYTRQADGAPLRGYLGGDLRGVINKLNEGYFSALGIDAIWMSPVVENIHGYMEASGRTYAYHGYWPKDWTALDANFGSEADLKELIDTAHGQGIRVLLDVIANHTGPETAQDPLWPPEWVRTAPVCDWSGFTGNVTCTLTDHLPDIRTESDDAVELPPFLQEKWRQEGRLDQETAELDTFFARTAHPRAPRYYLLKWLTDWVREYGVDGFRVDTAKHVEPEFWAELKLEAGEALSQWKQQNPDKKIDDKPFFMLGEVYGFGVDNFWNSDGRQFDFGDRKVDFYQYGFDSLINMGFVHQTEQPPADLFQQYADDLVAGSLKGAGVLNYISSHDDLESFDRDRSRTFESATKLVLAPGAVQIYYGDEIGRLLTDATAIYDAQLRSPMNWQYLANPDVQQLLAHWQKLLQFRRGHPSVGAGAHRVHQSTPLVFSRTLGDDMVLVALDNPVGEKLIPVFGIFAEGSAVRDAYSGNTATVENGAITLDTEYELVLLEASE
ncbi:alpha-amylase family glycosyl hydrolase [Microbulbifer sp. CAU 1566]|uniref:alpha-amylase family glycosyl hydrolase n=1 Tax=Microbulbifer sp. CAU 1566 TaxID=2933269 RepID=UPI002005241F|nr:alpha-amylase family glycosyl hydrolase [Microbulbifer sp. CAU 1566]